MSKAASKQQPGSPHEQRSFPFTKLYKAAPDERIAVIRAGVAAKKVKLLSAELRMEQRAVFNALRLSTATVNKKAARDEALSTEDGERVLGLAKLVGQLETMVEQSGIEQSGDPYGFDAPAWLSDWLTTPLPALGGDRPIGLLDTMEGQAVIARLLSQVQSGAYA